MAVYTKTGDKGMTSLLSGERVEKSGLRVEAYGNVDELSSTLGLARFFCHKQSVKDEILKIQKLNMLIMAELASNNLTEPYVKSEVIVELEKVLDELTAKLPPLNKFLISGENSGGAFLNLARTVTRRAERSLWRLSKEEFVSETLLIALNRISDLCFMLMRFEEMN